MEQLRKAIEQQIEGQIATVKAIKELLMQLFIDAGGDVQDTDDIRSFYVNERPFRFMEYNYLPAVFNNDVYKKYKYIRIKMYSLYDPYALVLINETEVIVGDIKEINGECVVKPFDFERVIRQYEGLNEWDRIQKMTKKQLSDYIKNRKSK